MDGVYTFDRSLIFSRAWSAYRIKRRHGISANFGEELSHQYRVSLIVRKHKSNQ